MASHRGLGWPWAKRALGPLSSRSKDHGTHSQGLEKVCLELFLSFSNIALLTRKITKK